MRLKSFFFFLLTCTMISVSAQTDTTLSLFYKTNEYRLTPVQEEALRVFIASRSDGSVLTIISFTDSVDTESHNEDLSWRRATEVQRFILQRLNMDSSFVKIFWKGEKTPAASNATEGGRQINRRTDVTIQMKITITPRVDARPDCSSDTLIVFPQGSMLSINACEYQRIKNCLEVTEILNAEAVRQQNMTTMTADGRLLISCGMLDIRFKKECPDTCFKNPVKVLFPLFADFNDSCEKCDRNARLYRFFANGRWNPGPEQQKVEIVTIDDKKYYRFEIFCPGRINCDCPKDGVNVKFKVKNRLRIEKVQMVYSCPLGSYVYTNTGDSRHTISGSFPCIPGKTDQTITLVATSRAGDTLTISNALLDGFRKRYSRPVCKFPQKLVVKKFLFLKFYKASLYRKYIFRKKDFVKSRS